MSAMLMTGECGMSAPLSSASAFSKGRAANHFVIRSRTTGMCCGRSAAEAKRGSRGSSGCPIMTQRRSKRCCAGAVKTIHFPSCVSNAPPGQHARAEVLEDDIAVRDQPPDDVLSLWQMQIERHELLVAIVDGEPVRAAVLGRAETPEVVTAAGHLGLDHLGAELGHQRAAERAGDHLGELEHPDSLQRSSGLCHGAAVYPVEAASAIGARASSDGPTSLGSRLSRGRVLTYHDSAPAGGPRGVHGRS